MSDNSTTLYGYWRSSCAWRVRLALQFKKIPYEYKAINLLKGEQLSSEYLQINPHGTVPSLQIDSTLMSQSIAILEYLEETRKDQGINLLPCSFKERALVRQIVQIIAADTHPIQNLRVLKKVGQIYADLGMQEAVDEKKKQWAAHWIQLSFNSLEKLLQKTSGTYCVGDQVSMADLCLIPQIYNAKRFGVDVSLYPTIQKVNDNCYQLPEFASCIPENQPDAVG